MILQQNIFKNQLPQPDTQSKYLQILKDIRDLFDIFKEEPEFDKKQYRKTLISYFNGDQEYSDRLSTLVPNQKDLIQEASSSEDSEIENYREGESKSLQSLDREKHKAKRALKYSPSFKSAIDLLVDIKDLELLRDLDSVNEQQLQLMYFLVIANIDVIQSVKKKQVIDQREEIVEVERELEAKEIKRNLDLFLVHTRFAKIKPLLLKTIRFEKCHSKKAILIEYREPNEVISLFKHLQSYQRQFVNKKKQQLDFYIGIDKRRDPTDNWSCAVIRNIPKTIGFDSLKKTLNKQTEKQEKHDILDIRVASFFTSKEEYRVAQIRLANIEQTLSFCKQWNNYGLNTQCLFKVHLHPLSNANNINLFETKLNLNGKESLHQKPDSSMRQGGSTLASSNIQSPCFYLSNAEPQISVEILNQPPHMTLNHQESQRDSAFQLSKEEEKAEQILSMPYTLSNPFPVDNRPLQNKLDLSTEQNKEPSQLAQEQIQSSCGSDILQHILQNDYIRKNSSQKRVNTPSKIPKDVKIKKSIEAKKQKLEKDKENLKEKLVGVKRSFENSSLNTLPTEKKSGKRGSKRGKMSQMEPLTHNAEDSISNLQPQSLQKKRGRPKVNKNISSEEEPQVVKKEEEDDEMFQKGSIEKQLQKEVNICSQDQTLIKPKQRGRARGTSRKTKIEPI